MARAGARVVLVDVLADIVAAVNAGESPYGDVGLARGLRRAAITGALTATVDPAATSRADAVVVCTGTPEGPDGVPEVDTVPRVVREYARHLRGDQLLAIRSTLPPGGTRRCEAALDALGVRVSLVYCPDRSLEGDALQELPRLPQLVGARSAEASRRAAALFAPVSSTTIPLSPEQAELAKLYANAWRFVTFAVANEFYRIAADLGVDYAEVYESMVFDYPRSAGIPRPGLAAGPCLPKDTKLLSANVPDGFALGTAAGVVNEGLPDRLVRRLADDYDLTSMTVGLLGMTFKGGSDDLRNSLAFRVDELLRKAGAHTLWSDPRVHGDDYVLVDELLKRSDLALITSPHPEYASIESTIPVIDIWGVAGRITMPW
jgi:UDP-N-acetyl-D-mannosaminuronic acid dehydrogenase